MPKGFEEMAKNTRSAINKAQDSAKSSMVGIGESVLNESNSNAPYETGKLVRSGSLSISGNRVEISYSEPYAVFVHEDVHLHHENGGPDFLRRAMSNAQKLEASFD